MLYMFVRCRRSRKLRECQVGFGDDACHQIVKVVCKTRNKDSQALQLLRGQEVFVVLLELGDVYSNPDAADEGTVWKITRDRGIQHPAVRSVGAAHPKLNSLRAASRMHCKVRNKFLLEVLRVHN